MKVIWLLKAHDFIHKRYCLRITLRVISREVGVHPAHLARAWRQSYGDTVASYIRKLRLTRAMQELQSGKKPVVQIAIDAGFYDQSHFHHAFKRYTGQTPAVFRKIGREGARS
jgi:AraC family transcriptional regulator